MCLKAILLPCVCLFNTVQNYEFQRVNAQKCCLMLQRKIRLLPFCPKSRCFVAVNRENCRCSVGVSSVLPLCVVAALSLLSLCSRRCVVGVNRESGTVRCRCEQREWHGALSVYRRCLAGSEQRPPSTERRAGEHRKKKQPISKKGRKKDENESRHCRENTTV